jgi:p-cumate 2,3-dioxygenase beta subunit
VSPITGAELRAAIEDFLYHEAALLDEWRLDEWLALFVPEARYVVPTTDLPEGDPERDLVFMDDDITRLQGRMNRLKSRHAHREFPWSRTRRLITNVRIVGRDGDLVTVTANFVCYRYRRYERIREYVGAYRYILKRSGDTFRIKERRVLIDAHELGSLGSVSFIL